VRIPPTQQPENAGKDRDPGRPPPTIASSEAILWKVCVGVPWRDLPDEFGEGSGKAPLSAHTFELARTALLLAAQGPPTSIVRWLTWSVR